MSAIEHALRDSHIACNVFDDNELALFSARGTAVAIGHPRAIASIAFHATIATEDPA